MCLIVFAYNSHPKYRLILAANRDEFYRRPTRAAKFWTEEDMPEILAGKDLKAGGTWMGIHKDKRWGALTNYRNPSTQKENPPTRGELVINFLKEQQDATEFLADIRDEAKQYNGFNLLLGDGNGIYHFSNHQQGVHEVEPGIHGLSNAFLDTPWPKLESAKSRLGGIIEKEEPDKAALFEMLTDDTLADDEHLPDTGISKEIEKAISSIFIKTEHYGSRCSTLLFIGKDGSVDFTERRYEPGTTSIKEENTYTF